MAVYAGSFSGSTPHRGGFLRWIISSGGLLFLMLLFSAISKLQQAGPVSCSPPACSIPPPRQGPLSAPSHYVSSRYGFALDYSSGNISPSQTTASSIAWDGTLSDGSEVSWSFNGVRTAGQTPEQLVNSVQSAHFADAQLSYTIPDAGIGYTVGYGNVYDVTVAAGDGSSIHDRLVITAATKRGLGIVLVGLGPYARSDPNSDPHPNPADTPLVELGDFEENVGSVTWPGDARL